MKISGKIYKVDGRLGATQILPAQYDQLSMKREWDQCAEHILEEYRGETRAKPQPGDILVAGSGLGSGHAHYHMGALMACKTAGVGALIGVGVDGMFQRAAIDMGYLTWGLPKLVDFVGDGDVVDIDLAAGNAFRAGDGETVSFTPVPDIILEILTAGGAFQWSLDRAKRNGKSTPLMH